MGVIEFLAAYWIWMLLVTMAVIGFRIYKADPIGWQNTTRRVSTGIRAHIESRKSVQQLDELGRTYEKDKWTAEFEGKPLQMIRGTSTPKPHQYAKTWFTNNGERANFKCTCGWQDWHVSTEAADRIFKKHVLEKKVADRQIAEKKKKLDASGGKFEW